MGPFRRRRLTKAGGRELFAIGVEEMSRAWLHQGRPTRVVEQD
jgi:hypothetical protein